MNTYKVTYYYSMTVEAEDEYEAEDTADREIERDWSGMTLGEILRGLVATVDEDDSQEREGIVRYAHMVGLAEEGL